MVLRAQGTTQLHTNRLHALAAALPALAGALALLACTGVPTPGTVATVPGATAPGANGPGDGQPDAGCLPGERGYLRASLRGAIDTEADWRGAQLQCEGGARPEGRGLRVSFLGPADAGGRRLRLVFGIAARPGTGATRNAATHITVIVEGRHRLYATQGDDQCAVEALVQQALPVTAAPAPGAARSYRIAARGYCIDPATALDGTERLYMNRFDFAGLARFDDNELHAAVKQD
jgi:hypothetical protein